MSTIASLNVALGMSTAAFSAGAKKAIGTTKGLASSITSLGSIVPGVGTAIAGLGAAIGAGALAAGFQSMVSGSMEAIDAAGDLAGRVGVTTESLTRLQYAAQLTGSEAETLAPTLLKMNENLGKAKEGSEVAKSLEKIGLSAEQLKQLDPGEAFVQIASAIGEVENPADKTAAAIAILGGEGGKLMNTFNAGGESIRALMEESDKLGNTITDVDAAKIGAANDAMDKMWKVIGGISNDIAVELAPFIEVAATKLLEFGTEGDRLSTVVSTGFEIVAKGIAYAADMFDVLVFGFRGAQYLITKGLALQSELWLGIGKGIAWIADQLGYKVKVTFLEDLNKSLHETADQIGRDFMDKLVEPSSGERVAQFFDSIRSGAQAAAEATANVAKENRGLVQSFDESTDAVAKLIAKLEEQNKFFGKDSGEVEIAKLKEEFGNDPRIAQAEALQAQLRQKEAAKQREDDAKSMRDAMQTPLQKFRAEMQRIDSLSARNPNDLKNGLLSGNEALLAKLQAQQEFASSQPQPQADTGPQRPAALERGTAAAFSASFGAQAKPFSKLERLNEQILTVQRQINEKTGGNYRIPA